MKESIEQTKPFVAVLLPFIPTTDKHGKITNNDHKVLFKDAEKRIKFLKNTHKYDVHETVLLLQRDEDIASVYERLKEKDAKLEIIAHGSKHFIGSFSPGPSLSPTELAAEFDTKFQTESPHHKIKCTFSILACNSATGKHSYAKKFFEALHDLKYTHISVDGIAGYITTNGGKQFVCDTDVLPSTPLSAIRTRSLDESKITYKKADRYEECKESLPACEPPHASIEKKMNFIHEETAAAASSSAPQTRDRASFVERLKEKQQQKQQMQHGK